MINILISGAGGDICNGVIKSLIASKINLKISNLVKFFLIKK
jgi:hypothetical protein